MKLTAVALVCCAAGTDARASHHTDFSGQEVVSVTPENREETGWFQHLQQTRGGCELEGDFDFWTDVKHVGRPVDLRVNAEQKAELVAVFGEERVSLKIPDVGELAESFSWAEPKQAGQRWAQNEYHNDYHSFEDIVEFVGQLEEDYSDLVTVTKFGTSHEGRDMIVACISTDGCNGDKPAFVMNGGIHAREWISHATVLYIAENLLIEHVANTSDLLEEIDFLIAPQVNPDGYAYTGTSTSNRMWRKTRKPNEGFPACPGTDPNRNFVFEWGGPGTSTNPCSDTYLGSSPADQPETAALQDLVFSTENVLVYFDTHSYGNYFLSSWGYTEEDPPDIDDINEAAKFATDAIYAVNGTRYVYGPSSTTLYPVSGGAKDTFYCQGDGKAKYSYTCELPGYNFGFLLPPEYIIPVGAETFEGYKAMARFALTKPDCV